MESLEQQERRARTLFESFHERAARDGEIVRIGGLIKPTAALVVGYQLEIGYHAIASGVAYRHKFDKEPLPRVFVNADGDQIYVLGGRYRFTPRGFVG
jgi:hypothetical protein